VLSGSLIPPGGIGSEEGWAMSFVTNSSVMSVKFDRDDRRVFVEIDGGDGTREFFVLVISGEKYVPASPSAVLVEVKNRETENYQVIKQGPAMC
jgi:hypothetical protein